MEKTLNLIDEAIEVLRIGNEAMAVNPNMKNRINIAHDQDLVLDALEGLIALAIAESKNEK